MLCDICHKNIATVHLTEIINSKVIELHLCQDCASVKTEELKHQLSLSDFFSGLIQTPREAPAKPLYCPFCNLSFEDFKKRGRFGCARCYEAFRDQLISLLRKIQGSAAHVGKTPFSLAESKSVQARIKEMRERLGRAIKLEEYEEAARIRDCLRKLEREKKDDE